MSRRLAHRPRFQHAQVQPRPLNRSHQEYLRQRWAYRQQRTSYTPPPLGYGLSALPWGWQRLRESLKRHQA
jgi:hypothetical protein